MTAAIEAVEIGKFQEARPSGGHGPVVRRHCRIVAGPAKPTPEMPLRVSGDATRLAPLREPADLAARLYH